MTFIGNLLWFVFGGIWLGLSWVIAGCLCCCTIIGIPFGVACFRISGFAFCPFGKKLVSDGSGGVGTTLLNLVWIVFAGVWLAVGHIVAGVFYCCTIIGIPAGIACFNIAQASFAPLGKEVVAK